MDYLPAAIDEPRLDAYVALMKACFPGTSKFDLPYLRWLYSANPDGPVVGFDAFEGSQLAAHYACIPGQAVVEGREVRVLLSLNTATHPGFQGKGLFTKLASMTYDAGAAAGFDSAYGVANANSTPGFTRKLGFQLVCPLEARVGMGRLFPGAGAAPAAPGFRRVRDAAAMQWRCGNPHNAVRVRRSGDIAQCFAPAYGNGVVAYHEFDAGQVAGAGESATRPSPLRLFLGLVPPGRKLGGMYMPIPLRLRPSPLNMIYRPLAGPTATIDRERTEFSFIDFDAY